MHLRIHFFHFFVFFDLIHISQMDIIMTAKHVMHNIFFLFVFINITEAIYNSDSNKTSTIHLNPYLQCVFFFFFRQMHHCFHSLKYYTVQRKQYVYFIFSCNSGGISNYVQFCWTISANHLLRYFLQRAKYVNAFNVFALHSAYSLQ